MKGKKENNWTRIKNVNKKFEKLNREKTQIRLQGRIVVVSRIIELIMLEYNLDLYASPDKTILIPTFVP